MLKMKVCGILLLAALAALTSAASVQKPRRLNVGLDKHRKHEGSLESYRQHVKSFKQQKLQKGEADVTLKDVQDIYYYGPMTVGTPAQTIQILYDTGSADLWVPSKKICKNISGYCAKHRTYNDKKSKTYKKNGKQFDIEYGSGYVSGFVSEDTVAVGGLKVKGQLFGEATDVDQDTAEDLFDGILGLSYASLSEIQTNPPFVNMIKQGVVDKPVFAFYLNKDEPSEGVSSGSAELVLGGVDTAHYTGDFTFTPVTKQEYWQISIDGIQLGNKKIYSSYAAVPDSGTSLLIGPSAPMDKINKALHGTYDQGLYVVDCSKISTFPDVSYIISGKKFVLHPEDYVLKVSNSESDDIVCISGFVGSDEIPFIILGDVFMRKYYTQFDMGNNKIGFATAK